MEDVWNDLALLFQGALLQINYKLANVEMWIDFYLQQADARASSSLKLESPNKRRYYLDCEYLLALCKISQTNRGIFHLFLTSPDDARTTQPMAAPILQATKDVTGEEYLLKCIPIIYDALMTALHECYDSLVVQSTQAKQVFHDCDREAQVEYGNNETSGRRQYEVKRQIMDGKLSVLTTAKGICVAMKDTIKELPRQSLTHCSSGKRPLEHTADAPLDGDGNLIDDPSAELLSGDHCVHVDSNLQQHNAIILIADQAMDDYVIVLDDSAKDDIRQTTRNKLRKISA